MRDWIDDLTEPQDASLWQIARIESMLGNVPYSEYEIRKIERKISDKSLSYESANFLINKLKQDFISPDPREQFKKMFSDGD